MGQPKETGISQDQPSGKLHRCCTSRHSSIVFLAVLTAMCDMIITTSTPKSNARAWYWSIPAFLVCCSRELKGLFRRGLPMVVEGTEGAGVERLTRSRSRTPAIPALDADEGQRKEKTHGRAKQGSKLKEASVPEGPAEANGMHLQSL